MLSETCDSEWITGKGVTSVMSTLKSSAGVGVVRTVGWTLPALPPRRCTGLDAGLNSSELLKMEMLP